MEWGWRRVCAIPAKIRIMDYGTYDKNKYRNYNQRPKPHIVRLVVGAMISLAIIVMLGGCVTQGKYQDLTMEKDQLENELAAMKVDKILDEYETVEVAYEKDGVIYKQSKELLAKGRKMDSLENLLNVQKEILSGTQSLLTSLTSDEWMVDELEGRLKLDLKTDVLFPINSAEITSEGATVLKDLTSYLKSIDRNVKIRVVGHTDDQQFVTEGYDNWDLSASRALAVVKAMRSEGISPSRLEAQAKGFYDPKVSNETERGRMINRRVEIQLIPDATLNESIAKLLTSKS